MPHIDDGNLFEVMRIILPEHRKLMDKHERERVADKRKQPVISEDQYSDFSLVIADAVLYKSKVKVTLYNPYSDEEYVGIPIMQHGRLRLVTDGSVMPIPLERVVGICPVA